MNEQEDRLARAREEIAARVASFKATQQKFEREREEYYATTLGNVWSGFNRPSFSTQLLIPKSKKPGATLPAFVATSADDDNTGRRKPSGEASARILQWLQRTPPGKKEPRQAKKVRHGGNEPAACGFSAQVQQPCQR